MIRNSSSSSTKANDGNDYYEDSEETTPIIMASALPVHYTYQTVTTTEDETYQYNSAVDGGDHGTTTIIPILLGQQIYNYHGNNNYQHYPNDDEERVCLVGGDRTTPIRYETVTIDDPDDEVNAHHHPESSMPLPYSDNNNNNNTYEDTIPNNVPLPQEADDTTDDCNNEKTSFLSMFRDGWFAVAFYLHLGAVFYAGYTKSHLGYQTIMDQWDFQKWEEEILKEVDDGMDITPEQIHQMEHFVGNLSDYLQVFPKRILLFNIILSGKFAFLSTFLYIILVIKPFTSFVVSSCLIGTAIATVILVMIVLVAVVPRVFVWPLLPFAVMCIMGVFYYIRLVWKMIPVASIHLKFALEGMNQNWGIYIWSFIFAELGFIWVFYWIYVTFGLLFFESSKCLDVIDMADSSSTTATQDSQQNNIGNGDDDAYLDPNCGRMGPILFILMLISLYWTQTVMMNTAQVTISGVFATFCFDKKDASGCCSSAVLHSLYRSLTFSFGSICFGSFFQGVVNDFRCLIGDDRTRVRSGVGENYGCCCCFWTNCIQDCTARIFEDVLKYFNQWAYVFVGIYGYSYLESGRRVMELFKAKGLVSISTERLSSYILACTTFLMGTLAGCFSIGLTLLVNHYHPDSQYESFVFGPLQGWKYFSFGFGFLTGYIVSSVMMNVVKGAINTLIVCFADSPTKMEENHPELTKVMIQAWSTAFPENQILFSNSTTALSTAEATTTALSVPITAARSSAVMV